MKYSLKELRARNNYTQSDVAKLLGVTPTTYVTWENEPTKVRIDKMMKVAEILGVELDDILLSRV